MESNYESRYSGEQVDAAVEYFLNHSQTEEASYEYQNTIYCESASGFPAPPFNSASLPCTLPEFPFSGTDGKLWRDVPNTQTKNWYQCVIKINSKSKKVVAQGTVLDMKGNTGENGQNGENGNDGINGENGTNGSNGNFTEFRYKRSSDYALTLTPTQKSSRYPSGWYTNWDDADVETYAEIQAHCIAEFDKYVRQFSTQLIASSEASKFMTEVVAPATFTQIDDKFYSIYAKRLTANTQQQALIVSCHKEFSTLYDECDTQDATKAEVNDKYHSIYKAYIDSDHFWALFQIYATISGEDNSLVGQWSNPQRIQGVDGKAGPTGSNGIDGIPGVNISVAFTIGDENGPRPDAANPLVSPYKDNYNALLVVGTKWTRESPTVSTTYPYIWFTQCRYIKRTVDGVTTYVFEAGDEWSAPARYTGLNGVTTTETVYRRNPIIYPAGIFALNTTYANDGNRAPYVYYNGNYYYLSHEGTWTSDNADNNPSNSTDADGTKYWTLMEHFEALYAKVGIVANGLVGSMVFNEEYVFSQQGINHNGSYYDHYEYFRKHYSTGVELTDPYDDNAAFRPNFCLNCRTGQVWSTSRDTAISNASSEIIQTVNSISLQVKEEIDGELRSAGIDIDAESVTITGKFKGTMDGTFEGKVSAKSLEVIGEDGLPVIVFDTYKAEMGTPQGGTAPEVGTPVLIMNYKGNQYLMSMIKLVTGSSSGTYRQTTYTTSELSTVTSVYMRTGAQVGTTYKKITAAPYLTLLNSDGTATSNKITAKLYASDGTTEVSWSTYMNKYYSGNLVEEYAGKTDLGAGIWAFKVVGSFASASGVYTGTPTSKTIALDLGDCYIAKPVSVYNKINISNGVMSTTTENIVTTEYIYRTGNGYTSASSTYRYVKCTGYTQSLKQLVGTSMSSSTTSSAYFMEQTNSSTVVTTIQLSSSAQIVGPKPLNPQAPTVE